MGGDGEYVGLVMQVLSVGVGRASRGYAKSRVLHDLEFVNVSV